MLRLVGAFSVAAAVLVSGSQLVRRQPIAQPSARQVSVNGTTIRYLEQGRGVPVVFVHGALSDHRYWEAQREAVAARYRFIALDRRYFGTAPWADSGAHHSQATHVADLAAFLRALDLAPAFVVGTSGGAAQALVLAIQHPGLVRGLFVNEPGLPSILTDPAVRKLVNEDRTGTARAAARAAARAGNMREAARLHVEFVNGNTTDFDSAPPRLKEMFVDNARTLALPEPPPVPITCAQLGQLQVPVAVTIGELTRPPFRVLADAAHRCIRGSRLVTIRAARHAAPRQNRAAFNEALLAFLARH